MRKIEPEFITGMGYIGASPGVLYRMGGAGEQTVVTGNPALLEGVKGNRFTSFTLHGKSTQGSTTGAQLISLNDSYGVTTINGVTKTPIGISAWELEGISKENALFYPYSSQTFLSLSKGDYVFSVFGTSKAKARYTIVGGESSGYIQAGQSQKISIQEDTKLTFNFMVENGVASNGILMIMLNSGSTSLPWEPYTGGAPSPSPEYPQEIKSAGQSGEIGVSVYGGNLFDAATALKTQIDAGLLYINDSGEVVLNGTFSNNNRNFYITLKPGVYRLTGGTIWHIIAPKDSVFDQTLTVDEETTFLCYINNGTYNQRVCNPMINVGSTALPYEPYKPAQTLIIPTPGGLPGIPVSSGGNYTDEKGQQWVADEIDLARGERVEWIGEYELTGKENVADFGLKPRSRIASITIPDAYMDIGAHSFLKAVMSNKYKQVSFDEVGNNINLIARGQQRNICISIPTDIGIEDFKTDLSNQYASGHPVKVFYKLDTPIRTPLPPETIAAYKALKTYSPTTTVINDAEAGMSVGYKRRK